MKVAETFNCFKPQRGKFTLKLSELAQGAKHSFKPQRGKFTPRKMKEETVFYLGFKPQRGKFTLGSIFDKGVFAQFQTPTGEIYTRWRR